MAVTKQNVLSQKAKNTSKMSDLTRYVCFGLLAVYYSILTSQSPYALNIVKNSSCLLQFIAGVGVFAIICDYLQYWCGAKNSENALKLGSNDSYTYPDDWAKKGRLLFFRLKQYSTFLGVFALALTLVRNFPS